MSDSADVKRTSYIIMQDQIENPNKGDNNQYFFIWRMRLEIRGKKLNNGRLAFVINLSTVSKRFIAKKHIQILPKLPFYRRYYLFISKLMPC